MRECVACNRVKKCAGVHRWEIVHLKSSRCVSERASQCAPGRLEEPAEVRLRLSAEAHKAEAPGAGGGSAFPLASPEPNPEGGDPDTWSLC